MRWKHAACRHFTSSTRRIEVGARHARLFLLAVSFCLLVFPTGCAAVLHALTLCACYCCVLQRAVASEFPPSHFFSLLLLFFFLSLFFFGLFWTRQGQSTTIGLARATRQSGKPPKRRGCTPRCLARPWTITPISPLWACEARHLPLLLLFF